METEAADAIPLITILIGVGVLFAARWLLFTGIIWGMLRIQGLNYTWPGLLLTTALASVAYLIPLWFIAAAVAFVIVYAGLKMVTQAEHTDLMFTIVIGNALMYVAGLWMLAAVLPGAEDLRALRDSEDQGAERGSGFFPDYAGMLNQASNTLAQATGRTGTNSAARNGPGTAGRAATPGGIELKGITVMSSGSLAMLKAGDRTETVAEKGLLTVRGPKGVTRYVCESITTNTVVLRRQGSEPPERLTLRLD
jgi:hypothetical protein